MYRTNVGVVFLDPVSRQFRNISKQLRAVSPLRRAASSVQASFSLNIFLLRFWSVRRSITDMVKEQIKKQEDFIEYVQNEYVDFFKHRN